MHSRLLCLLPVRNAAADLPGYFASVRRFADGIIALDDGSTDATGDLLAAEPLVKTVLTNPRRASYHGWDDAANRQRLLTAAAELEPDWVLSLDADEQIDAADGAALRTFLATDALPGCAYGFKVYRMWGDLTQYDRAGLWVYRLFAYEPGQRFPTQRLHFVPIPTTIPRTRWLRTTVRIQHLAGLTAERRQARFAKYREADPDNTFQHSYRDLLTTPVDILPWQRRPADLPVLVTPELDGWDAAPAITGQVPVPEPATDPDHPALSAIIISRNDEATIARTVASVVNQDVPAPFETILVTSGTDRTAEIVREQFPSVTVIALPKPALPGEARNAGLAVARGTYISFPGSHVELPAGSLAARLAAHRRGYAMVAGTPLNGTPTRSGWASYFLDHSGVLPERPSSELIGPPAHCSYSRAALDAVGGFPADLRAGEDSVVNQELTRHGYVAYRAQDLTFVHNSPCRTPRRLLRHHFIRGQSYGRILRQRHGDRHATLRSEAAHALGVGYVPRRIATTTQHVAAWGGELRPHYRRAKPLVIAGAVAFWLGAWSSLLRHDGGGTPSPSNSPYPAVRATASSRPPSARRKGISQFWARVRERKAPLS